MRMRVCQLDDIAVRTFDGFGRRLGAGAIVDLDEVIGSDVAGEPVTLEAALGEHVRSFAELEVSAPVLPSPVLDNVDDGVEEEN